MMFIDRNNGTTTAFHGGEFLEGGHNVTRIQADGDELEHIRNRFSNIPISNKNRVQVWYGDMAKFIVENW